MMASVCEHQQSDFSVQSQFTGGGCRSPHRLTNGVFAPTDVHAARQPNPIRTARNPGGPCMTVRRLRSDQCAAPVTPCRHAAHLGADKRLWRAGRLSLIIRLRHVQCFVPSPIHHSAAAPLRAGTAGQHSRRQQRQCSGSRSATHGRRPFRATGYLSTRRRVSTGTLTLRKSTHYTARPSFNREH